MERRSEVNQLGLSGSDTKWGYSGEIRRRLSIDGWKTLYTSKQWIRRKCTICDSDSACVLWGPSHPNSQHFYLCENSDFTTPAYPHIFSPWIVAIIFRWCLLALNSRYQIPCHVPVASLPSLMGIVTLAPINALLICAYRNVSPTIWCCYPPLSNNSKSKNLQAYHPVPQHYAYTNFPSYLRAQFYPVHHSYPPGHPHPSSHLDSARKTYVV